MANHTGRSPDGGPSTPQPTDDAQTAIGEIARDVARLNAAIGSVAQFASNELIRSQGPEAVGLITRHVAHELNNLLTVLQGSVDLLRLPNLADERRARYLNAIEASTDRAARLTGQMQELARKLAPKCATFDAAARIAAPGQSKSYSFVPVVADPDEPLMINVDPSDFDAAITVLARAAGGDSPELVKVTVGVAATSHAGQEGRASPITDATIAIAFSAKHDGNQIATGWLAKNLLANLSLADNITPEWLQTFAFIEKSDGALVAGTLEDGGPTLTLYLPRHRPDQP